MQMENEINCKKSTAKAQCSLYTNMFVEVVSVMSLIAENLIFIHSKKISHY